MAASTKADGDLETVFGEVLHSLGTLPGVIGQLGGVVSKMVSGLTEFLSRAGGLFAVTTAASAASTARAVAGGAGGGLTPAVVAPLVSTLNRVAMAALRLATMMERQAVTASGLPWMGPRAVASPVAPPAAKGGAPAAGGGEAAAAAGGLGSLTAVAGVAAAGIGALALTVNLVHQQFQKALGFVSKFNPGVVAQFQMMMDNLSATIGSAFVPMVQAASQVVRQWTSALAPVMQQLAPVVREVSNTFGNILVRVLQQVATLMRGMIPLWQTLAQVAAVLAQVLLLPVVVLSQVARGLQLMFRVLLEFTPLGLVIKAVGAALAVLGEVVKVLEAAFDIVTTVVGSVMSAVGAFFAGLFGGVDVMGSLNRAIQWVIRNMYVLAVQMAKLVGAMGIADALINSVAGKTDPGAVAAQQPQIKSLDQLAKDIAVAAAAAGGAAGPGGIKDEKDFWAKTLEEMRAAKANGMSIKDLLGNIIDEIRKLNPFATGPAPNPGGGAVGSGGLPDASGGGGFWGGVAGAVVGGIPGGIVGRRLAGG